jgi:signal transduction histidine kinase
MVLWLAAAFCLFDLTGMHPALAQPLQSPELHIAKTAGTRVEQHLFLDDTGALDFSAARAVPYQTFNPFERLPLDGRIAWLKLTITRAESDTSPLSLRVIPPIFDTIVLYTPAPDQPGGWKATTLDRQAAASVIEVKDCVTSGQIYLKINSAVNTSLLVTAGSLSEITQQSHQLDVLVAILTTLCALMWISLVLRTLHHFSWFGAAICIFLPAFVARVWIVLFYANSLLGVPAEMVSRLYVPSFLILTVLGGCICQLMALALFKDSRSIAWIWGAVMLLFGNFVLSLFYASAAIKINDALLPFCCVFQMTLLIYTARLAPHQLKSWAEKSAFAVLSLVAAMLIAKAFQINGLSTYRDATQPFDALLETLVLRSTLPALFLIFANWVFEKTRAGRLEQINSHLISTQQSLALESKRLQRQHNFTAMLAHEIKNPLTASQLALASIAKRLDSNDPVFKRAEKIRTSLLEIDAIVDRCAELDGYEQGQMPMTITSFTVRELITSVKEANPSELIYMLMRGINEDATLTSDLHYIKLILSNLLSNALKYSPPDSLVELEIRSQTHAHAPFIEFIVSNEIGPGGLPDAEQLFERFYRAESARNQSGAGLGLWLSQSLAHALSSELVYQGEDGRASFSFSLKIT